MLNFKSQMGQVLLITLLIMAGVFAIGMSVSLIFLNEVRLSRQSLESVKAIYAAESGLECELYQYFKSSTSTCDVINIMTNNTSFISTTTPATGPIPTSTQSIGISKGVRRGLQVETEL